MLVGKSTCYAVMISKKEGEVLKFAISIALV